MFYSLYHESVIANIANFAIFASEQRENVAQRAVLDAEGTLTHRKYTKNF